jgi:hypothetical protein
MKTTSSGPSEPVNIVTLKWGTRYGAEYVNRLFSSVARNLSLPFNFVCFTDDASGLSDGIVSFPIPEMDLKPKKLKTPWRKLCLFKAGLPLSGFCLFLDLDVVITGNLDDFFFFEPEKIPIIYDWPRLTRKIFPKGPPVGNSSVFRFIANECTFVYEQFLREKEWALANFRPPQSYLTHCIRPRMVFWPDQWVASFKVHCLPPWPLNLIKTAKLPQKARIVIFHGHPNPDEARDGRWLLENKSAWKRIYKFTKPTPWIAEHWR